MAIASHGIAATQLHHSLKLPMQNYAGYFLEHCLRLQAGEALSLAIESPYPVRLNVHHHTEERTLYLVDELVEGSATTDTFDIPLDGEYCLEVMNPENRASGFELQLDYRVSKGS